MRVVLCCVPQTGHVTPLLPLARAFSDRGDEVTVVSGPSVAGAVTDQGLGFRGAGPGWEAWFEALRARTRGIPGDGLAPDRIEGYFVPRLFGEVGTALMVDELLDVCTELHPELLVFDPYAFAGPLVAQLTGARPVLHAIGPMLGPAALDLVADAVSPIWREFGVDVPAAAGTSSGETLAICPPSLDPPAAGLPGVRLLRPVALPRPDPAELPVSFVDPSLPLVYVTLGTFSNNDLDLFRLVLGALADRPVNVLVTIGRDNDPAALGPLHDNARVERFVPQADLLPRCAAVVHHAGAGTMFGAAAHGLPAVAIPQSADNFLIAERLAAAGAARVLLPGEVTAAAVRAGVDAALEGTALRDAARRLATEIADMPPPEEVAAALAR